MELKLSGEIFDLMDIRQTIEEAQEDVELYIDSPGGDAFEGLETAHCISNAKCKVTAHVGFMAASAAAIIALACDAVEISKNSLLMLHNCWGISIGNKDQLRNDADGMEAIDKVMHSIISEHCRDDSILGKIDAGDLFLTGEDAAAMFDHVTVVSAPVKEGIAAMAPLADLVRENRALRQQLMEKPKEESVPYVVTDALKALMDKAERV